MVFIWIVSHLLTVIVGAMEVECDTADDVMSYLERGSAYRHTGSTQMNEKSSRSHAVFTVLIGEHTREAIFSFFAHSLCLSLVPYIRNFKHVDNLPVFKITN